MFSTTETPKKNIGAILLLAGLCVLAYLPAFNNGFISDDYVILDRLDSVRHDVFYLFSVPPECYRFTSYICFGTLRFLFGYQAPWYYGFNLLLHFINSILLWKLLTRITGSHATGYLAAVLFAVIPGHQEAIMWLAAMNETLLGCCLLACLILWIKDKQFEQRAAPTNRLIEQMQARAPQNLAILDFPANPWIARNIFRMVPGWQPEMIHVGPAASECAQCLTLQWDPAQERYREIR